MEVPFHLPLELFQGCDSENIAHEALMVLVNTRTVINVNISYCLVFYMWDFLLRLRNFKKQYNPILFRRSCHFFNISLTPQTYLSFAPALAPPLPSLLLLLLLSRLSIPLKQTSPPPKTLATHRWGWIRHPHLASPPPLPLCPCGYLPV